MQKTNLKQFVLLVCFTLIIAWCSANSLIENDGYSNIPVKEAHVQSIPNTGDYIVTFTLPNGDEYYGEFTVTN